MTERRTHSRRRGTRRHRTFGQRVLWYIPSALVEYPFEVAMTSWGLVSGPAILLGVTHPPAAQAVMPMLVETAWAAAMLLGAATMAYGLWQGRYAGYVARGLALTGSVCLAYAGAILGYIGATGGLPTAGIFIAVGLLAYLRALWLKTRGHILMEINRDGS